MSPRRTPFQWRSHLARPESAEAEGENCVQAAYSPVVTPATSEVQNPPPSSPPVDLSDPGGTDELGAGVDLLINNASVSFKGAFVEEDPRGSAA